jgi:hypothetical protein
LAIDQLYEQIRMLKQREVRVIDKAPNLSPYHQLTQNAHQAIGAEIIS